MEQAVMHLLHIAAWLFVIIFILAFIGVIAIVRFVIGLFRRTEQAVESGVASVEHTLRR